MAGARTGAEYVAALDEREIRVEIEGEQYVGNVSKIPQLRNVVKTYAELFDLQHDPALRDTMTYESPTSGERVGTAFLQPTSVDDVARRGAAMRVWAEHSLGNLGRTGDYCSSAVMAMAGAEEWFGEFGPNVRAYYEHVRENDLLLTHTLIFPQANRSVGPSQQKEQTIAARIVDRNDNGIVIRGARMLATIGPFADEILVMPSTVLRGGADDAPYSYAFGIPCDAPGLRFLCRESFDLGRSHFDHPLASRFEEIDAIVVFDDVLVPWERCFVVGEPDLCNGIYSETSAAAHMTHQVVTRTRAKTEYILGLVSLLADAIGIEQFQHVQEKIAEVIVALETCKALARAAEADAAPNRFGVVTPAWAPLNACRNWYPRTYPRFVEILRQLGASGLMAIPTEADAFGPAQEDVERYLQSATLDGPERLRLFRLAWDTCLSAFAGRQALYEYFFFGDPVRMAGALVASYDREPYKQRIRDFMARED
ncbi:MAG TPA: 4-hydroxyphenylacetate 3-monooxygenase, oxygenase component [Gaiellaceae bacterium]|nr:4-hydroxyphenylacetate 3-monooxygenase, oxygenase component [Gaiellaceae bacterium]